MKSITMLPLDRDESANNTDRKRATSPANPSSGPERPDDGTDQKGLLPVVPGLPDVTGLGEALKGLFGR